MKTRIALKMKKRHNDKIKIELGLEKDGRKCINVWNFSQYNDGYMNEATPKQHLKLNS